MQGLSPDATTMWWLVVSLCLVLLPHLPRLPIWYVPLMGLAIAERMSHEYLRRSPLPGFIRMAVTVAAVGAVAMSYGTIVGRQAGVALMSIMIALKLMETYRRRDVYFLVALGYFVAVTQFLFSQSVYLVAWIMVATAMVTATLVTFELQPSRLRERRADGRGWGPLLKRTAMLLAQALPMMVFMFILFPRLATPLWGMPEDSTEARTGISGEMSPGNVLELLIDDSPAFRVAFEGPPPPQHMLYWRGPVLWDFDGTTWRRPGLALRVPAVVDTSRVDDPIRYRITQEATERNWLFGLDVPIEVPEAGHMQIDHTMYRREPLMQLISYSLTSDPDYVIDPVLSPLRRRAALALPSGLNPRSTALAREWATRHNGDVDAVVNEALGWFNREFTYSFTPPPLGINTVDDFLFNTQEGYCEYYASAFTALMRGAGIPARVVGGYMGGYFNETGGYILVRQSDAHAWSEIWRPDRGWVRVDPTASVAPERVNQGARQALDQRRGTLDYEWLMNIRNRFDAVHNFWNKWVLEFDQARQQSLFKPVGLDHFKPQHGLIALIIVCLLLGGAISIWLLRRQTVGGLDEATKLYRRFENRARRAGVPRRIGEAPMRYAERVARQLPHQATAIRDIAAIYEALRYRADPGEYDLKQLKTAVNALKPRRRSRANP